MNANASKGALSLCIVSLQCSSRSQGEKEMYTLGITNFPIPGEPGFPLNAMYVKPANKQEDGENQHIDRAEYHIREFTQKTKVTFLLREASRHRGPVMMDTSFQDVKLEVEFHGVTNSTYRTSVASS